MTSTLSIVPDPAPPVVLPPAIRMGDLREKWTQEGRRFFREAAVPVTCDVQMKSLWLNNKQAFLARGFTIRQHNGQWFLQQWLNREKDQWTLTPYGQQKLAAVMAPPNLPMETPPDETKVMDLPALPLDLEAKLFDYQVQPARQIFRAVMNGEQEWGYPGAWDTSDLGTGKTFQSLAAAIATGYEIGVICPLSVISAWKKAFQHFGQCPRFVRNYESLRTGRRDYVSLEHHINGQGKKVKRFNWNVDPKHTLLMFDEAHNLKNAGTLNQGLLMAALRQKFPVICISGTLAADPTHMRATGRVVGLHKGSGDYLRFLTEHECAACGNSWSFKGGPKGKLALQRINRRVFPNRGARTKIADLGDRFPETQIMAEAFETGETRAIAEAFKKAEESIANLERQGKPEWEIKMMRASAYMAAWHESERLKVPAIVDMCKTEIEEGRSVAVFVNFTDVRVALMEKLKTRCAIYGGQNQTQRQYCIDAFQTEKSRVIIANIDAGGVGVSLHDVNGEYPRTAIILPTNKVVSLTQALGRVHRAGGKSRSRQIIFFAAETVEEQICANVRRKMSQIATLNDGDLDPAAKF